MVSPRTPTLLSAFICLLCLTGTTWGDVQGPEIIKVTEGSDVTLPCSITGNIELRRFDWKKDGQKEVYVYDAGPSSSQGLSGNNEQFKGRVSHFSGELKNGNASIMIRNVKVADSGNYTCEFKHLPNQKFLMKLLVGPEIINVTEGSDVTLPCSITGNIESQRFDWKKDGQKEVYVYDAGPSSSQGRSGQSDQFKGRVSHFSGELKNGNASIMIRNTKVADSGNYTCEFQHLPNQKFLMKLLVGAAPTPCVRTLKHTNDWVQLQCEVHGYTFKPDVQWQDSDGKTLPAEEPQVSERGGSYDIILNITVTKTDTYRCVSTQEEIRHQVYAETFVPVHVPGFPTGHVVGAVLGSLLVGAVVGIALFVLIKKRCIPNPGQSKTSVPDEDPHLYL